MTEQEIAANDKRLSDAAVIDKVQREFEEKIEKLEAAKRKAKKKLDAEEQPPQPPLRALTVQELFDRPLPQYVIDQWFPDTGLIQIVGHPGTLKTFFALHASLAIASGLTNFFGYTITQTRQPVLYIAAEGGGAFQYRIRAWCHEHEIDPLDLLFRIIPLPLNLRDENVQKDLTALVSEMKPILIIVDTLSRCTPGAEENSAKDMGEVVNFCTVLQRPERTTVAFIHHPPKAATTNGGGRGSGVVFGAIDTQIELTTESEEDEAVIDTRNVTVKCTKQKDDQRPLPLELQGCVTPVRNSDGIEMVHESGRPITSLVMRLGSSKDARDAKQQKQEDTQHGTDLLILRTIQQYPTATSIQQLRMRAGVKNNIVAETVGRLLRAEWISEGKRGSPYTILPLGAEQIKGDF